MSWQLLVGDARERLLDLVPASVQTCVTSPPYFGLRDYGRDGQIGLEATPDEFVAALVAVFREVRRVLRDDGTVWLNLGDSYSGSPRGNKGEGLDAWKGSGLHGIAAGSERYAATLSAGTGTGADKSRLPGVKPKDLLGIPWRVAFALRADGWYLRSDVIWAKPNPMPESVTDRPTKAHEYLFLLAKGPRYFYDADAIRERHAFAEDTRPRRAYNGKGNPEGRALSGDAARLGLHDEGRNKRSVWTVATQPYAGAHFATFPPKLIEPCILAGCPEGGTVLDPFAGAGTTLMVAERLGRDSIGIELNPAYAELARNRIIADCPLHNAAAEVAA